MFVTLERLEALNIDPLVLARVRGQLGTRAQDESPISLRSILDTHGLEVAVSCLTAVTGKDSELRLFAVACARELQHLMKDARSVSALSVAERFAQGGADLAELQQARQNAGRATAAAPRAQDDQVCSLVEFVCDESAVTAAQSSARAAWRLKTSSQKSQAAKLKEICA